MSNPLCAFKAQNWVSGWLAWLLLVLWLVIGRSAYAEQAFLASEQAFAFEAQSLSQTQVELKWKIAQDYYLYQHQLAVVQGQQPVKFSLPPAQPKHDAYFGDTKVYYQQLTFPIQVQPNQSYQVTYQGCAEKGLCYPISQTSFQTDAEGLVILADQSSTKAQQRVFQSTQHSAFQQRITTDVPAEGDTVSATSVPNDTAQDEVWSSRLHEQSLAWSIVLFLGLGCLLAFTPCSLPMLPILSGLLIRKHVGVKAGTISLIFVLSMASVYALLGVMAASVGSNFQRWLQQPAVLIAFSGLFVVFALNLFGLFELKLPQSWSNRLDQLQGKQKGGTLLGAALMGVLSALLVGPCMTAPLAGTLLYISQTQNMLIGAVLLFSLGLGMGLPLMVLSLIGQRAVPKPGIWMMYVRHVFAFIMLGLSLYFVRPLLSIEIFNLSLLLIALILAVYLLYLMVKSYTLWLRGTAALLLVLLGGVSVWKGTQYWQYQNQQHMVWTVVTTQAEFKAALQQAREKQQPILVDLYADWCIACQPIERNIWNNPEIQQTLTHVTKIKVDLSRYDESQKQLLQAWQMLGPPTVLFLDADGQEQRHLRLTGEFKRAKLAAHLTEFRQSQ